MVSVSGLGAEDTAYGGTTSGSVGGEEGVEEKGSSVALLGRGVCAGVGSASAD